ncbi:MAG: DHH family phosphoesterase [bacterium]
MNPKLEQYYRRFNIEAGYKFDTFFTQLSLTDYPEKLPYLFDIENFCLRLFTALNENQKICIYSDYDTDAVTATGVMYWGLVDLGFKKENLSFYAPDRFTEGYGMNPEAVLELAKNNDLIISVDCGINSTLEAEVVSHTNCDLIITDHHHLHQDLPQCIAVINPRLAEFYSQNPLLLKPILQTTVKESENWTKKVYHDPKGFLTDPQKFLSSSVTGVGVAWFSLVWFGYFLAEM